MEKFWNKENQSTLLAQCVDNLFFLGRLLLFYSNNTPGLPVWQGITYLVGRGGVAGEGDQPSFLGPDVKFNEIKLFEPQKNVNNIKVGCRNNFVSFHHRVRWVQDQLTVVVGTLSHVSFEGYMYMINFSILAGLLPFVRVFLTHGGGKAVQICMGSIVTCLWGCVGNRSPTIVLLQKDIGSVGMLALCFRL